MTTLVPANETALLFTLIGVFDSIGAMAGSPLLNLGLKKGLEMGGMAAGLPFFIGAMIYAISGISIWSLRPPPSKTIIPQEFADDSDIDEYDGSQI
jgi:hypothetical protein